MNESSSPRRAHVRAAGWTRLSHGLYLPPGPSNPLAAWQLVLPETGAFTHLTAAQAFGWWLPPLPADLPVFAAQSVSEPRPRREGLRVTRHRRDVRTVTMDGIRYVEPLECLLACARDLSLLDLVVVLDAALHREACTTDDVRAACDGRAGSPMLRRALAHADGRSESAWETLLRMLHEACGVHVQPQLELAPLTGQDARADLWVIGTNALHEYDGADHLERRQQRKDLRRNRGLVNTQWVRRGYTSYDVLHQAVAILRDADLSLGRPHHPGRVRAWHALLAESLFTPSGMQGFRRRLGLESGHERQVMG